MKKTFSLLLLLFMVLLSVAQEGSNAQKSGAFASGRLGAYGGVNFANIKEDDEEFNKSLTGFQLGLMYRLYSPGDLFSLWIEPGYNAIGGKYEESFEDQTYSSSVNLGYIMIPVMARFQAQNGLFGDVGVQPQFLVSAKAKFDGEPDEDIKDEINGFDFGIPFGVGYEYKKKVGIRAGYYLGLSNLVKDGGSDIQAFNRVFSIRLHFRF